VLVSGAARKRTESMASRVKYLELADRPDFMELFVRALNFG